MENPTPITTHDDIKRETMDVDVLIVGGGSAGLSAALKLSQMIEAHNLAVSEGRLKAEPISEQMIAVIEKASEVGAHSLSGAVMNPVSLRELVPNYRELECPIEAVCDEDSVHYLGTDFNFKLPITPPPFKNEGNYLISVSKFNRWLGKLCEQRGINIFSGFAAVEALYEGDKVVGVRTGDKGLDKNSQPKPNFEPGLLLKSKLTIFAEGTRGSLFKHVAKKLGLREGKNPEVFEEGVKEVIQCRPGSVVPGQVIHTLGFPLSKSIGGTFIYTYPNDQIVIGLVGFMDTEDPLFDPHRELQKLKTHPFIYKMIEGGKVIAYGGKTLPAGGFYSMPKLYADGCLVVGDSASMVDVQKLKGIHLAMKSGMLAAETAMTAILKNDFSQNCLKDYEEKIRHSYVHSDLYRVRNFHQTLSQGFLVGMPQIALQEMTGGRGLIDHMPAHIDYTTTKPVVDVWGSGAKEDEANKLPKADGILFFDKLSSVYLTGTMHDENSPNHLHVANTDICRDICHPQYNSPCNHFCPAAVYEMVDDGAHKKKLQINYTNCIHCKSCDIKCPMDNIDWTAPEGGGGPQYQLT